jgi:hypothetical protein
VEAIDGAAQAGGAAPGDYSVAAKRATRSCSEAERATLGPALCAGGGGFHRAELLRLRCSTLAASAASDDTVRQSLLQFFCVCVDNICFRCRLSICV